jgi:CTP:molybdopterin cytidylyltransferase MocA
MAGMPTSSPSVAGLVLAAGAGSRYGMPKALARDAEGLPWLVREIRTLAEAGCTPVIVVLGARGDDAQALLGEFGLAGDTGDTGNTNHSNQNTKPSPNPNQNQNPSSSHTPNPNRPITVHAADWADGLSASLRAGLRAATALVPAPTAIAVVPVDVPDLAAATVTRLIGALPGDAGSVDPGTLRQACFDGRPGHPVVIGRAHWATLIQSVAGDTGARPYLQAHDTRLVECADLETGVDIDE